MDNKDLKAIEEYKKFVDKSKNKESINELKEYTLREEKTDKVFDKLYVLLEDLHGNVSKERKTYINDIVKDVVEQIPSIRKNIITEEINNIPKPKDGLNGKDGQKGKDGISLIYKGINTEHPKKPKTGWFYRNEIQKLVYIYDGKKWEVLIKDGMNNGVSGGGTSLREVRTNIQNRSKDANFNNSGTGLSATTIQDALVQINSNVTSGTAGVISIFDQVGAITEFTSANFNTNISYPPYNEGTLFYDNVNKTLAMYNDQSDVTLQIGQETHIRTVNKSGSTIPNGTVVYINGAQGNRPTILPLSASSLDIHVAGVTTHDILNNQEGLVTVNGTVGGLNTSDFSEGDQLYLSTSGTFTLTPPEAPIQVIEIGIVLVSHNNNGKIELRVNHTHPIEESSNVNGTSAVEGSLLVYDSINQYWDATGNTSAFTYNDLNLRYISTSGTDSTNRGNIVNPYRTLDYAISQITDASETNRYKILLYPGVYEETNIPIQQKEYVSVGSLGCSLTTVIVANSGSNALIYGRRNSSLKDVTLKNSNGYCVEMNESGTYNLDNIMFKDSKNWISVNNVNGVVDLNKSTYTSTSGSVNTDIGYRVLTGKIISNNIKIKDSVSATTVFDISGSNSEIDCITLESESEYIQELFKGRSGGEINLKSFDVRNCTSALILETSATAKVYSGFIKNSEQAIYINDYSELEIYSVSCKDCTLDLYALSASNVRGAGNGFRDDKIIIEQGADVSLSYISNVPGDEGFEIKGELHVGSPENPKESVFGEGDSYINKTLVYQGNSTSAINDITSLSQSYTGSTFSFSANSVDQCIYMASDRKNDGNYVTHLGVELILTTQALGGNVSFEYWNGSQWKSFNFMITQSDPPYYPFAKNLNVISGSYQVRYDNYELKPIRWVKNDINGSGIDRYWIRWRITSTFTQAPVFEQIKLHSNKYKINSDGWPEYFGTARPLGTLPWNFGRLGKNPQMGNGDVYLGDNIFVNFQNNVWDTDGDVTGFLSTIPFDCDTSTPIRFSWSVRPGSTGTVNWTVRWSYSKDGDDIYTNTTTAPTSAVNQKTITTSASTTDGKQKWFSVNLDISDLLPRVESGFPYNIWVSIERTTSTGNLRGFSINPIYTKWTEGGHVDIDND